MRERLRAGLMRHRDWLDLDRGRLEEAEAVERVAARTGLPREEIARLMAIVPVSLVPVPAVVDLLGKVKGAGRRLFCLSNMHQVSIRHLEDSYPFLGLFDGRVVSCRVGMIKPETGIYTHLLDRHGLMAPETLFIDDMDANLRPAAELGMRTVLFRDPERCEQDLVSAGVLRAASTGRHG